MFKYKCHRIWPFPVNCLGSLLLSFSRMGSHLEGLPYHTSFPAASNTNACGTDLIPCCCSNSTIFPLAQPQFTFYISGFCAINCCNWDSGSVVTDRTVTLANFWVSWAKCGTCYLHGPQLVPNISRSKGYAALGLLARVTRRVEFIISAFI